MKFKVLLIEHDEASLRVLRRVIGKANLEVVAATSLIEAKVIFEQSSPESYLCAVIDYALPDAPNGEAIEYAVDAFIPAVVITDSVEAQIRERILSRPVVDYIPKHNAQMFEYLSRLLARLQKNKQIGVLVVDKSRVKRGQITELLSRHNFVTYASSKGEQALALLKSNPDIKMMVTEQDIADMQGTALVAQARKMFDKDELSIIGISSDKRPALLAQFIKSGANDYLTTPYCHEEFFCRIVQNIELVEQIEEIRRAANTDYLTGLPNRRHFFSEANAALKRGTSCMSLALLDLDHFKSVNDTFGHDFGDVVLKEIAKLIMSHFSNFCIARFGGEEFCIYMPDTDYESAYTLLDKFRLQVAKTSITQKNISKTCTVSIGLACSPDQKIEKMLALADEHLYRAKALGRNQVVGEA